MASIGPVLTKLIEQKVDQNMKDLNGHGPLGYLKDPKYYKELCKGVGNGISNGSQVIKFESQDTGLKSSPQISGHGTGIGISVDAEFLDEQIYTLFRQEVIDEFKFTNHEPFPPSKGNTGEYLRAISKGIADSVKEHFRTAYQLNSVDEVYVGTGKINNGKYSGLSATAIENLILAESPLLKGKLWPKLAKVIAKAYVDAIHNHSTGKTVISGICVPSPGQACGIPSSGKGQGTAT